jgi:hypothetical protein
VEVHVLDGRAVHPGLGLGEEPVDRDGARGDRGRQAGAGEPLGDGREPA